MIVNPSYFEPTIITDLFFKGWDRQVINQGYCYEWSYFAHKLFNEVDIKLWSTVNRHHAFIKVGNNFYDSEAPQGMSVWQDLPCCRRVNPSQAWQMDLESYKKYWLKASRAERINRNIPYWDYVDKNFNLLKRNILHG